MREQSWTWSSRRTDDASSQNPKDRCDSVPFLPSSRHEEGQHDERTTKYHLGTKNTRWVYFILPLSLLLNVSLLAWLLASSGISSGLGPQQPYSPAASAARYSVRNTDSYDMHSSPFVGEPRLELDQAWSDLLRSTNLRISEDEMRVMGKTSVALKDGSGYLGYLEVHHMLHCLKRMKQYRHLDHYKDISLEQYDLPHWDHCIEVLRRGVMCNADLMVDTVEWNEDGTKLHGINRWPRKCVDWDSVQEFTDSRAVEWNHVSVVGSVLPPKSNRSSESMDLAVD